MPIAPRKLTGLLLQNTKFKRFCKLKCNVCDIMCCKNFTGKSALMASSMANTYWCKDCGRILCSNHRYFGDSVTPRVKYFLTLQAFTQVSSSL